MGANGLLVATQVSPGVYTMQASDAAKTTFAPGDGAVFMTVRSSLYFIWAFQTCQNSTK
jgi:hypothetical protein